MSRDILPHTRWKSTLGTPRAGILSMIQRLRSGHWFAYEFLADRIQYLHDELIRTEGELAATQKALLAADDLVVAFEAKAGNAAQSPTIGAVEPPAFLVIDTQSLALCADESPAPLKIHRD
jgi:hypothetical protein